MVDRIAYALGRPGVVEPGMNILCAVSGGPDSMALLHAMLSVSPRFGLSLCVGHVEHGIRKERSKEDAAFVQEQCAKAGVPFFLRSVDAPMLARTQKLSLEDAARRARFEALFDIAYEAGAARIALAHHMDDQAETVLLHLFRGSALGGFCGMRLLREDGILRPMLQVRRPEVLAYCRQYGIEYRLDETNADLRYARNALRQKVLPCVESIFPGAVAGIARTAEIIQDEEAFMRASAQKALEECEKADGTLHAGALLALPAAISRRVALDWLKRNGDAARMEARHVEALLHLCGAGTGAALDVPGGRARNNYGEITWEGRLAAPVEGETELKVPGVTLFGDTSIQATVLNELPDDLKNHPGEYDYFDYDVFPKRAVIRTRRTGDRFRPLGMRGTQPLKDYFINRKVARALRGRIPVCAAGSRILWVAGMGVNDSVRVRPGKTERVLKLEITRKGEEECNA
ncbi:MAG: tRNA lysidine(34) synthetase TilS [Bacillota bacterium]